MNKIRKHPLISELQKLKESSRHAIAQGGKYNLDKFKKYLHIERDIEKRLKEIITKSSYLEVSQLILVCGNVGDGKSHLLSYLHSEIPDEISQFHIHNDATESHNPNETSDNTLYRLLEDFRDEKILQSDSKIILAINLGTLSKFIEAHSAEFQTLTKFVNQQSILSTISDDTEESVSEHHFHYINFADYHLYSLTEKGPISPTISELLSKIVTDSESNIIFKAYKEIKDDSRFSRCPVRFNFEFLFDEKNRDLIIQMIIQAIVQNKEIISVRSILNFIHDLVVPVRLSNDDLNSLKNIQQLSDTELLTCLIPNYIFEHAALSNIFSRITELDPCNSRRIQTDELLLQLQNVEDIEDFFSNNISMEWCNSVFQTVKIRSINRSILSKYFLRILHFQNGLKTVHELDDFKEYIISLYHFNHGESNYLSKLYQLVDNAIKKWYGDPQKGDKVVLKLGRRQIKYRIFKDLRTNVNPIVLNKKTTETGILHQFVQEFSVRYKSPISKDKDIHISIDYSLFKILKMIERGYRPNKKDNNNFVYFVYFINEVTQDNSQNTLYIDEVNIGKPVDYKLTKDPFGGYKFELI